MTTKPDRPARALAWCCLLVLLAEWLTLAILGDRVWWTVPLLYGPRWAMAAPVLGVVPWLLLDVRRAALPALAGLAVALLAIMGLELGVQRASGARGVPFRVLELNADGSTGFRHFSEISAEFRASNPDLIVVAECSPDLRRALEQLREYQFRAGPTADLCLLSRGEIVAWAQRDQMDLWKQNGSGAIVRAVVQTRAGPIRIGLVHLATPRNALDNYFDRSELFKQGSSTRANIALRDLESALAQAWIFSGQEFPTIVVGDFNLPVESAIYRRHWGSLRNAFSRAGTGTGYTKRTHFWGVRIDHVLTSQDIGTQASFVGRDVGSDHRPLVADLVLPADQRTSTAR